MRACGYVRTALADGGVTAAVQRRQMEEFLKDLGLSVHRWYVDEGVSGNEELAEREEGAAMLADLADGVYDTVVVLTPARLARDPAVYQRALDAVLEAGGHLRVLAAGTL